MRYVLGIDSGGTKYLVRACDLDGAVIAEYTGAPAAHYRLSGQDLLDRIDTNIDRCLAQFDGDRSDCAYLVCGTTGIDAESDRATVGAIYAALHGFECPTLCVNDAEVAQFAVTGGVGAVVISGTGSVAFGRNVRGETARSGGWPICIFGDEGSGTWIGYQALHHLSLWFDGRVRSSTLSERLLRDLRIGRREDLMAICIGIEQMAWEDPGLAAMVDAAAEDGDPYALDILRQAATQTVDLADSVIRKLALEREPGFTVGAWGSGIVNSRLHFESFKARLTERYANARVVIADVDAAMGACRMALAALRDDPVALAGPTRRT